MIIGFTQRRQTVLEAHTPFPQAQSFPITVDVRAMVASEINYTVSYKTPASNVGRTANVADSSPANLLDHDALFGYFNPSTGDLEDIRHISNGSIVQLTVIIVNDFNVELLECFTIEVFSPEVVGDRDRFECFDDDDNSDAFFCLHELCIEDDDGLFRDIIRWIYSLNIHSFFTCRTICCCICKDNLYFN